MPFCPRESDSEVGGERDVMSQSIGLQVGIKPIFLQGILPTWLALWPAHTYPFILVTNKAFIHDIVLYKAKH